MVERILGVRREGAQLVIDPCVARDWKGFEVTYRDGAGEIHVVVDNPQGLEHGVRSVLIDGQESLDRAIPLTGAPGRREIRVVMG